MKILKTVFFLALITLSIESFSKTAITYVKNGITRDLILNYDIDCDGFVPAENVTIIDCFAFVFNNGNTGSNELFNVLEENSYTIKTNGNDIVFVNSITEETTHLMSVQELENLPEVYFIDIYITADGMVNIIVTATNPISNVENKNSNQYSYFNEFSVAELLEEKSINNVVVFPNPSKEDINIFIPNSVIENSSNLKIQLFDISGKIVREINQIKNSNTTFSKDNLPAGEYLYRVINNRKVVDEGKIIFN